MMGDLVDDGAPDEAHEVALSLRFEEERPPEEGDAVGRG